MSKSPNESRGASRRPWKTVAVVALVMTASAGIFAAVPGRQAEASPVAITVHKSPTCGCCEKWIHHLEENGFEVTTHDTEHVHHIKERQGVPPHLSSCHTAEVDGFTIEGHVPADVIRKLLAERPPVLGLAVRGMPVGSPGMEDGSRKEPYAVLSFDEEGRTSVFARR